MSTFKVEVIPIRIEEHPNADALELGVVGAYRSIVRKGQFEDGDLVAYIPEQAIVPEGILEEMGLIGRLAGKQKNRVKAVRLRGVLSQGLCYPAREGWEAGDNVTAEMGITKYVPAIPASMSGEVWAAGQHRTIKYDIENWKRYPYILQDGEEVAFTEKLHGTWAQFALLPDNLAHEEHGRMSITSKGLGGKGLAFKPFVEANKTNLYCRAARAFDMERRLSDRFGIEVGSGVTIFVLGEIFGAGVQDLAYGSSTGKDETLGFRVFDIHFRDPSGEGRYADHAELSLYCEQMGLERVPVLYEGPFSEAVMHEYTNGMETVSGNAIHIREGIVMRPAMERRHDELGRVQLKSVSENYLTRKGSATEYQ